LREANRARRTADIIELAGSEPSYVGWWSAASFHGFTTQKPMTVFVAVTKQVPTRAIEGTEVQFVIDDSVGCLRKSLEGITVTSPLR